MMQKMQQALCGTSSCKLYGARVALTYAHLSVVYTWRRRHILRLLQLVIACKIMSTLVNFYVPPEKLPQVPHVVLLSVHWVNEWKFLFATHYMCECVWVCVASICYWLCRKRHVAVAVAVAKTKCLPQRPCKKFLNLNVKFSVPESYLHTHTHTLLDTLKYTQREPPFI